MRLCLIVLCTIVIFSSVTVNANVFKREYVEHSELVIPQKFVPLDFTEAFKGFASDVVANEIFIEHGNTFGASAAYTFGLGQLLAVLNERVFNVPNDGIDEALRTQYGSITTAYKDMTESLVEVGGILNDFKKRVFISLG
jgi:hypothetical protein